MKSQEMITKIQSHPATSEWLKNTIQTALSRDIVDALHDALCLVSILEKIVREKCD